MSNAEHWLDRLEQFKEELEGIHMLLDEVLHVLRQVRRNGFEVDGSDARCCNDGRSATDAQSLQIDTDDDTDFSIEPQDPQPSTTAVPEKPRTKLFD